MNPTWSRIVAVVVILGVLAGIMTIVVKNDKEAVTAAPASPAEAVSAQDADEGPLPFAMLPVSKQVQAPDFAVKTADGHAFRLSEAVKRGPVLIDFWASYCGPCRAEFPDYQSLYDHYKAKGVQFYTINSYDQARDIKKFAKSGGLTMPMLVDADGSVAGNYGVDSIPLTLVIDGKRNVVALSTGYDPQMKDDLPKTLDQLIAANT